VRVLAAIDAANRRAWNEEDEINDPRYMIRRVLPERWPCSLDWIIKNIEDGGNE